MYTLCRVGHKNRPGVASRLRKGRNGCGQRMEAERRRREKKKDSRNSQILVEFGGSGKLLDSSLVLAKGGIDETDVCEDPGGVGDLGEELQGLLKVLLVVGLESGSPGLELCLERHGGLVVRVERGRALSDGWGD